MTASVEHRSHARRAARAAAVVGFVLITACSSDGDAGSTATTVASVAAPSSVSTGDPSVPSPTGSDAEGGFVPTPEIEDLNPITFSDRKLRWDVQERLVHNCMAERGFDYAISPYGEDPQRYPALTLSRIPTEGYQQSPLAAVDPVLSGDETSPGYEDAVEPCLDDAFATMYNKPRATETQDGKETSLPSTVAEEFRALPGDDPSARTMSDQRYIALEAEWSDCMERNGVPAPSSEELVGRFAERSSDQPPSQEEIDAATADYHCLVEIDYYARNAAIQQEYLDQWAQQNQAAIAELTTRAQQESARIVELAAELGIG